MGRAVPGRHAQDRRLMRLPGGFDCSGRCRTLSGVEATGSFGSPGAQQLVEKTLRRK